MNREKEKKAEGKHTEFILLFEKPSIFRLAGVESTFGQVICTNTALAFVQGKLCFYPAQPSSAGEHEKSSEVAPRTKDGIRMEYM